MNKFVLFHTAFIGDIVLALPLVQQIRARFPESHIAFVAIPAAAALLANHPAIDEIIAYDKKGNDAGVAGIFALAGRLRKSRYTVAMVPHRSFRSALIVRLAGIPRRIGFSRSAGRFLLTDIVPYEEQSHEIRRNLNLLQPFGFKESGTVLPRLYPDADDGKAVDDLLGSERAVAMIAIAPGSVWNTKRWLKERFAEVCMVLAGEGHTVVLLGGKDDEALCSGIAGNARNGRVVNAAGRLTLLQSAALIGRCVAVVSNDSAPMHIAVAMRTPVVAIFGATVPEFGFGPSGERDQVVQTGGLACRPCSIHGGDVCPVTTFVCMKNITPEMVLEKIHFILKTHVQS